MKSNGLDSRNSLDLGLCKFILYLPVSSQNWCSPRTSEGDFIRNRIFANVISGGSADEVIPELGWVINPKVGSEKGEGDLDAERQREQKTLWRRRQSHAATSLGMQEGTRIWEMQRKFSPTAWEGAPLTPWFQTSGFQVCETTRFCCFKPSGLWQCYENSMKLTHGYKQGSRLQGYTVIIKFFSLILFALKY